MTVAYNVYGKEFEKSPTTGSYAAITCAALVVGTGGALLLDKSDLWISQLQSRTSILASIESISVSIDVRSPVEHLKNIRTSLAPSITDMAHLVGVSRQSVHKWLTGGNLDTDHIERIKSISEIADKVSAAGLNQPKWLVKMKLFDGESLMDLIRDDRSTSQHVEILIAEAKNREVQYKNSGIRQSTTAPTDDWKSGESIPFIED